jgi:phage terminase Nu1 subunit (DNA packaging protein)
VTILSQKHKAAIAVAMQRNANANSVLIDERIAATAAKRKQSELLLAKARNEVILKELVQKQAGFLLMAFRQKVLSIPQRYSRKLAELTDVNKVNQMLKEMSYTLLNELQDFPSKISDPDWLKTLEEEENGR